MSPRVGPPVERGRRRREEAGGQREVEALGRVGNDERALLHRAVERQGGLERLVAGGSEEDVETVALAGGVERLGLGVVRQVLDRGAVQALAGGQVRDRADDEAAGSDHAGRVSEEHVVDLPPPREEGVVVVEAGLDVGLARGERRDVDRLDARSTRIGRFLPDVGPGRAAVDADVDVGDVAGRTVVAVIRVEAHLRGRETGHVDRGGDEGRVEVGEAGAVAVDDGVVARAARQVAAEVAAERIGTDVDVPGVVAGLVGDLPAVRQSAALERLVQAVDVEGVARRIAGFRVDEELPVLHHAARRVERGRQRHRSASGQVAGCDDVIRKV